MTLQTRGPIVTRTSAIAAIAPAPKAEPQAAAAARIHLAARIAGRDAKVAARAAKQAEKLGADRLTLGQPAAGGRQAEARDAKLLAGRMRDQARALAAGAAGKDDRPLCEAMDALTGAVDAGARPRDIAARLLASVRPLERTVPAAEPAAPARPTAEVRVIVTPPKPLPPAPALMPVPPAFFPAPRQPQRVAAIIADQAQTANHGLNLAIGGMAGIALGLAVAPAVGMLAVPIGAGVAFAVVLGGPNWFGV